MAAKLTKEELEETEKIIKKHENDKFQDDDDLEDEL